MDDIKYVQNRGQQIFLLGLTITIFISVYLFTRPMLFLKTLNIMEIIINFDTQETGRRAVKLDEIPRIETELLKSSNKVDIPTRVPDIFSYDRSIRVKPKQVRLIPSKKPAKVRPKPKPKVVIPSKQVTPPKHSVKLERNLDDAFKKIDFIGRINRQDKWCAMVKFKGFESEYKKRIITIGPGQEIYPESQVYLKEAGQSRTSGDYYLILETTGPGENHISKMYVIEN